MQKPKLIEYAISEQDLEKAKRTKFALKIIVVIICILDLIVIGYGRNIFCNSYTIYFLLIGLPPYGPLIIYFFLKWVTRKTSPRFNSAIRYEIDCNNYDQWWIRSQEKFWFSLSGRSFETELANLYKRLGYEVEVTKHSDDKGVDIWLYQDGQRYPIQCKAHKRPIGPAIAREFYGTMKHFKSKYGILASLSGFTKGVFEYTKGKPIELITIQWIIDKQRSLEDSDTLTPSDEG